MTKVDDYRVLLESTDRWEPLLLEESRLPGPRANLELAAAVADTGGREQFTRLLLWTPDRAPVGSREEFLALCGTIGLGTLAAQGDVGVRNELRQLAADPRWRIREGVAMALQRLGTADAAALLAVAEEWADGSPYEQRAVVAGLCEPALLVDQGVARAVLSVLDAITVSFAGMTDRRSDGWRILRQGLAYGWSVAVAAAPDAGRPLMEQWMASDDRDVLWVMRQNLAKKRMAAAGSDWVAHWRERLS